MTALVELREAGVADLAEVMTVMDDAFEPAFGEAWTRSQCQGILELPRVWLTIARTLAVALGSGARKLHLEVRDGNVALGLYVRSGFVEVGRRRGYYRGTGGQLFDALSLASVLETDRA